MTIQIPTYDHIDQIRQLNSKYLISHLTDAQRQNGFIRIEYDQDDLQEIIANKEIVIATNGEKVIGYYLIGRKSGKAALDYQKNKANSLFDTLGISFAKIGYGCQVCIDQEYRELGLSKLMLNKLLENVFQKYDYLLSTISSENIVSLQNSTAIGWKPINLLEKPVFYLLKVI